ncbi:hypothetical protein [Tissierella sp. Yu-01]|uniref:hypothetical protein n=1 Tax=Tissierella sp. Yu-01 TaxID=3035694 RepID=UPI00240DF07C|nr:hypothetical protein [Tissierella sp. Yu-01]WFA10278.1 hypothetical protein P3962_06935 [Tissierella sp. Yu-01]
MKKSKLIIIYAILLLVLFGCGGGEEKGQQQEIKSKDKAPDSLKDLSSGMDDILKSLSDIERLSLDIPLSEDGEKKQEKPGEEQPPGGGQGGNQEKQSSDGGGQEGQGQGGQQSQGGGQQDQQGQQGQQGQEQQKQTPDEKKNEQIKSKWEEIQKKLDEIHPHWNSFEAEGQKKGATKEAGDNFETSFNKMTKAIEAKNIIEIYDYTSQSLSNLKPFYDLYLDDIGGDLSLLKYAAYQGYTRALLGDLEGAANALSNREENINKIRLKLTDEKEKENVEKITLSVSDFKDSLAENSRMLFMIKKDIVIENIKALE